MSFRKMRLVPEHLYERLHQDPKPRSVDFGDADNAVIIDMTQEIEPVLKDTARPIEERVRILHQHLLRKIASDKDESEKPVSQKQETDKKADDKETADEDKARSEKIREVAVAQRNHIILGKQVIC